MNKKNIDITQNNFTNEITHTHTTVLRPCFRDHPGEPVPEENFWTLWCKGRLTEADTQTIRLSATPSGLTSAHFHHPIFYRPDALHAAQPTVSKHWIQKSIVTIASQTARHPKMTLPVAASTSTCNAFPETTRLGIPNCISTGSAVFAQLTAENPYTLQRVLKRD